MMRRKFIQDRQKYRNEAIASLEAEAVEMQKFHQEQLAKIKVETKKRIKTAKAKKTAAQKAKAKKTIAKIESEAKAKEKDLDEIRAYFEKESMDPPISTERWGQGWELERVEITLDGNADKRYWRPPSPFNPDAWIKHYYGSSFCNSLSKGFPKNPETLTTPDRAEKLICEYIMLAVIYDNAPIMPQSRKLCSSHDDEWACDLWGSISWFSPMPEEPLSLRQRRAPHIDKALNHVGKDLAELREFCLGHLLGQ